MITDAETGAADAPPDDSEELYLLAVPELVLYPGLMSPVQFGEPSLRRVIDAAFGQGDRRVAVVSREPRLGEDGEPTLLGAIREVGCVAHIPRMRRMSDGAMQILLQGQERVRVVTVIEGSDPLAARVVAAPDEASESDTVQALSRTLQQQFSRIAELIPQLGTEIQVAMANTEDPVQLVYLLAAAVRMDEAERYQILATDGIEAKLRLLLRIASRELELLELGSKLQSEAAGEIDKAQREYFLRQQLKAIRAELGEDEPGRAEVEELRERLDAANLPDEAATAARRELRRLEQMPPQAAEFHVIRTYLELILELPWQAQTKDNLDLRRARRILDEDHHGLEKVKDRILEYLAVRALKPDLRGPILCFVGPPGVGKTSLGQSIARSLGRRFARISLGGVHDEAEIRGHRRTYIGAMPGRILDRIRRAEVRNPVLMLDEIDKVQQSLHGDPSSALLEVLDPAQNHAFRDNYLDLDFDLSQVLFIATGNVLSTVQPALLDRLEVIEIEGYTESEKTAIARKYLIPRQLGENGLDAGRLRLSAAALQKLIAAYTRESGVRNLERTIATVCRKAARQIAEEGVERVSVGVGDLVDLLGPERVYPDLLLREPQPGVVAGLSVSATGGQVLVVEALTMPGSGNLRLTGQLGEVMQESAQAAFSYVRSRAEQFGVAPEQFEKRDFHLHVPAGATPKDGPSAGVTIAAALLSAALGRPAAGDLAMTGEITLTGQVLPVGGIKEKVLAARRAGLARVVVPRQNANDLRELPAEVREQMSLLTAETVTDVLRVALPGVAEGEG